MTTTDQTSAEIEWAKFWELVGNCETGASLSIGFLRRAHSDLEDFMRSQHEKSAARIAELEAILGDIHHVAVDNFSNTNDAHEIELWGEIMNLADERALQKSKGDE